MYYEKSTLSNGITVLTEAMPSVRSVTVGVWFRVGTRDEEAGEAGISHFMEHMMFKGTEKRSSMDISAGFERLGAESNAFTSREYTCYYARLIDERIEDALDILSDMMLHSAYAPDEIVSEREVVIEEIARSEDAPDDFVFDLFGRTLFPTSPLGKPVLGTRESVGGFGHDDLMNYYGKRYHAGNCAIVASGSVDHASFVELCERYFGSMRRGERTVRTFTPEQRELYFRALRKETEQAHLVYGMESLPVGHEDSFAQALLDQVLGGGMSSRLFQEIREKRGLAYAVYAGSAPHEGVGSFTVYAGTRPDNLAEVASLVATEMKRICTEGVSSDELERVRSYAIGQTTLAMEATRTRMLRLGRRYTIGAPLLSLDETIEAYRAVTLEDLARVAERTYTQKPTIAVISPAEEDEVRELLKGVIEQ
ncbi:MAG: M16 family metallopeptidase [Coriobacteriales bacterium]|jgi:predicted Zn-dependent peptidase